MSEANRGPATAAGETDSGARHDTALKLSEEAEPFAMEGEPARPAVVEPDAATLQALSDLEESRAREESLRERLARLEERLTEVDAAREAAEEIRRVRGAL